MDKIFIKNLNIDTIIGIYHYEKNKKQTLILDLEIKTDVRKAALSDNIEDALDYSKIVEYILILCTNHRFVLIETLAEFLAQSIMETFQTNWIKIAITKPGALSQTRDVGIVIERSL